MKIVRNYRIKVRMGIGREGEATNGFLTTMDTVLLRRHAGL